MNIELVHAVNNGILTLEKAEAKQAEIDKAKAKAAKAKTDAAKAAKMPTPAAPTKKGEQAQ